MERLKNHFNLIIISVFIGLTTFQVSGENKKYLIEQTSTPELYSATEQIYYVSPSGNDTSGTGSCDNPWKTLFKASQQVTTSDNTIFLKAGTYNETQEATISVGVNIDGDGRDVTIINNTLNSSGHYAIRLASGTEGTDGNQFIRNITLTGSSLTALNGIYVLLRSNVSIYQCTIKDFLGSAINFEGQASWSTRPSVYATGNKLYNDSIVNCSDRAYGLGMFIFAGQDGFLVYDNYFNQTQRSTGHNGNIGNSVEGYNKNFKFHNNTSIKPDTDGPTNWNFHLETWNNEGGNACYNNIFVGGVALDIGYYFAEKGLSDYSWSFHDNLVMLRTQQASTSRVSVGANLETGGSDLYIYNNHFKNVASPIELEGNSQAVTFENVFIHNNIFENSGYSDNSFSQNILIYATKSDTLRNIQIDNNTFYNNNPATIRTHVSIQSEDTAAVVEVYFRNNIAVNSSSSSGFFRFRSHVGVIDSITLANNIVYGNGNSNNLYYDSGDPVTKVSVVNTIKQDPLLSGDFSLQNNSPAINAATDIGYGDDIGAVQERIPSANPIIVTE